MSDKSRFLIMCESSKPAHVTHSTAISHILRNCNNNYSLLCLKSSSESSFQWFARALKAFFTLKKNQIVCVTSIGTVPTLLLILFFKLFNSKIVYYCHEPGPLGYLMLRQNIFFSFSIYFSNLLLSTVATIVFVPNPYVRTIGFKRARYFPLPHIPVDTFLYKKPKYEVGLIGHITTERGLDFLCQVSTKYSVGILTPSIIDDSKYYKLNIVSQGIGYTDELKSEFLKSVGCIVSIRPQIYNQSGVTVETLIRGVPIITSVHDHYVAIYFRKYLPQLTCEQFDFHSIDKAIDDVLNICNQDKILIKKKAEKIFYYNNIRRVSALLRERL